MDDTPTPRPHRDTKPQNPGEFTDALALEDAEADAVPRRRTRRGRASAKPWAAPAESLAKKHG